MAQSENHRHSLLRHRDAAYLLALRLSGNVADAEDAVQEAYVRVFKYSARVPEDPGQLKWFLRIVANATKAAQLSEGSRAHRERSAAMEKPHQTADESEAALREAIAETLPQLDEHLRVAVSLHYEQGLSYAEAAEILDKPEGTLRKYASLGIEALREKLAQAGFRTSTASISGVLVAGLGVRSSPALAAAVEQLAASSTTTAAGLALAKTALSAKVAAAVCALCLSGAVIYSLSGGAAPVSETAGSDKEPAAQKASDPLEKTLDVDFRNAYLSEVVAGIKQQTGSEVDFPRVLDRSFVFTLGQKGITLKALLARLLEAGNLQLHLKGAHIGLSAKADEAMIKRLGDGLKAGEIQPRCEAASDLGQLGDLRVYPILLNALAEAPEPLAAWILFALGGGDLNEQYAMLRYCSLDDAAVRALQRRTAEFKRGRLVQSIIALLAMTDNARAVDVLLDYSRSADPLYSDQAKKALARSTHPKAVTHLKELFEKAAGHAEKRSQLARLLKGKLSDAAVFEANVAFLRQAKTYDDGLYAAAEAIADIDPKRGTEALLQLVGDERALQFARAAAANVLLVRKDAGVVGPLITLMKQAEDHTKFSIAVALAFNDAAAVVRNNADVIAHLQRWMREGVRPDFTGVVSDQGDGQAAANSYLRTRVAYALGYVGGPNVVEPLIDLGKDKDEALQQEVIMALGRSAAAEAIPELKRRLSGKLSSFARSALSMIDADAAMEVLLEHARGSEENRANVIGVLGTAPHKAAARALLTMFQANPKEAFSSYARALGNHNDPQLIKALEESLESEDREKRLTAAHALAAQRHPQCAKPLLEFLAEGSASEKARAAAGLIALREPKAIEQVAAALAQGAFGAETSGLSMQIGGTRQPKAIEVLCAELSSKNLDRALCAAHGLDNADDNKAVAALCSRALDPTVEKRLRQTAAGALFACTNPRCLPALIALSADTNGEVKRTAAHALASTPLSNDSRVIDALIKMLGGDDTELRQIARIGLMNHSHEPEIKAALEAAGTPGARAQPPSVQTPGDF